MTTPERSGDPTTGNVLCANGAMMEGVDAATPPPISRAQSSCRTSVPPVAPSPMRMALTRARIMAALPKGHALHPAE